MATREHHRRTEHSWESVRRGARPLDWSNRPLPFKLYRELEPRLLPTELPEPSVPALRVLSGEEGPGVEPDLPWLARLLFYSAGVTRQARGAAGPILFRAAPSAGALYPIELYVVAGDLPGLEAGVYHFGPVDFALRRLREGDLRGALARAAADPRPGAAPFSVVLTGIPWRTMWKYGERGFRHLYWDAGTVLANLLAVAASSGWPAGVLGGFVDRQVSDLLDLGDPPEHPLAVVPVGPPGAQAEEAPPPSPLELEVLPLSASPVRHPLAEEAQAAGELESGEAVEAWRREATRSSPGAALTGVPDPRLDGDETLDEVILRRGSTRRFRRDPVPGSALAWSMSVAARPVPGDFLAAGGSLLERLLSVHAVDGMEPGAYAWTPEGPSRIEIESSRDHTARLCLEQPLGGDAAFTVFLVSPLEEVSSRLGDRGYRMAQLEAGIVSGRLHLAPYALGLGATGLTFYDEEVRRHFATQALPMLVTAVGVPAYRARPGKRPSEAPPLRLELRP